MHLTVPPGVVYILQRWNRFVLPPVLAYVCLRFGASSRDLNIPTWVRLIICLLSIPVSLLLSELWIAYRDQREAASRGAVLPKSVEDKWPLGLGTVFEMRAAFASHFLAYAFFEWTERYGYLFRFQTPGEIRIFTADPEHIKRILATDFSNYEKGPTFRAQMQTLLGIGVFNSDGDMWKFHRSISRPFFSKDRITHFDIFDRHASNVIEKIQHRMSEGYPIDWQDLVSRFTLDSATEFLFGKDLKTLADPLPYASTTPMEKMSTNGSSATEFAQAFLDAQLIAARRPRGLIPWPLRELFHDRVKKPMEVIRKFVDPILNDALDKKASRKSSGSKKEVEISEEDTLLSYLVELTDDPEILRDETLNILLAGRDTTASTLTSAVYKLAEHPDILQKLRSEILEKVGPTRRPTYEDIRDMRYLRAFINEVLRLYPPVPFNVRFTINATEWPSAPGDPPIYIPANTRCIYSVFVMHRRKDLWGPDAHEFDPERFIDERLTKYLTPNPFIFLPFNGGPRICLGQQFAYNETSFMLIRLLQRFSSINLRQEAHPESLPPPGWAQSKGSNGKDRVWLESHLTMFARGGLWVTMGEAPYSESP